MFQILLTNIYSALSHILYALSQISLIDGSLHTTTPQIKWFTNYMCTVDVLLQLYGRTSWTITKRLEKKFDGNYSVCYLHQILGATPYKTAFRRPLTFHLINHPSKTKKICGAILEKFGRTNKRCFLMASNTWTYPQNLTFTSSVWILDAI